MRYLIGSGVMLLLAIQLPADAVAQSCPKNAVRYSLSIWPRDTFSKAGEVRTHRHACGRTLVCIGGRPRNCYWQ